MSRNFDKRIKALKEVLSRREAFKRAQERESHRIQYWDEFNHRIEAEPGNYIHALSGPLWMANPNREFWLEFFGDPGYRGVFEEALETFTQKEREKDAAGVV